MFSVLFWHLYFYQHAAVLCLCYLSTVIYSLTLTTTIVKNALLIGRFGPRLSSNVLMLCPIKLRLFACSLPPFCLDLWSLVDKNERHLHHGPSPVQPTLPPLSEGKQVDTTVINSLSWDSGHILQEIATCLNAATFTDCSASRSVDGSL